jgi:hypothetical protein
MLVQHTNRGTESKENEMAKTGTNRKLRADLTTEQRERAERIGRLEYTSTRNPFTYRAHDPKKFIPSREQH